MKIAIIGAGAIGSIIAAYLTKAGRDAVLVGREEQVKAIDGKGLKVKGVGGEETVKVRAKLRLDGPCDLAIFSTKTQDLERAYAQNSEYLESCAVLTTQNGVQADNILSSHYDRQQQLSSIVMFGATYTDPGEVIYNFPGDWIIGKPFTPLDPRFYETIENLKTEELKVVDTPDIMGMKYLKLFVNFNNGIPAVIGKSMQETFADLGLCRLSVMLLKEGVAVIRKANIKLVSLPGFPAERIHGLIEMPEEQAAGIINKTLTTLSEEPLYGSILQSIMRKRPSEIDFINGEVVTMAKAMRQEAPLNERIVDMVHEVERTGKYFSAGDVKKAFGLKAEAMHDSSPHD